MQTLKKILGAAIDAYKRNPVRATSYGTGAVVFAAAQLHVVLDPVSVTKTLTGLAALVVATEASRAKVQPAVADVEPVDVV